MENIALILITVTLLLLAIILGLLTLLVFKFLRQPSMTAQTTIQPSKDVQNPNVPRSEFHPDIIKRMSELQKVKTRHNDLFCPNHIEEPGEVNCAICEKIFCKACIKPFKTMHFCKEHLPLIMRYDWDEVLTLKTSTQDPEQGVYLYDLKKELFDNEQIPTYVETHYKINVDQDYIETYLVLFAVKESVDELKIRFKNFLEQK